LQPTKFGVGVLEKTTKNIIKNTLKMVYKKKMKKGQTMKNPSKFKLECPNLLQVFSSTFTIVCFKG